MQAIKAAEDEIAGGKEAVIVGEPILDGDAELREIEKEQRGYRLHLQLTEKHGKVDFTELDGIVDDWRERSAWACGPAAMLDAAYDNIANYDANLQFVRHTLSMDTVLPDNPLRDRAITSPAIWALAFWAIILTEAAIGLVLAFAAVQLVRNARAPATVFNAANEVAVAAFIAGKIRFGAIARLVEATIESWIRGGNLAPLTSADDAIAVDHNARNKAAALLPHIALKAS